MNDTDKAVTLFDPAVIRVAKSYVRRIRNENKRAFAENFLGAILRNEQRPPRPTLQTLSYMAAQSVEIHLCDLFNV